MRGECLGRTIHTTPSGSDEDARNKLENWWRQPIARAAWLEARGEPIRQGASDETG